MKLKKLLISASAIAAGSGLLATVLTSCAKSSVDDKLKIELNGDGLLYNPGNMGDTYKISYQQAIENALTRSNNWAQFKNALAEEIVYKWFENRMATKGTEDKNTNFRTSYDEWVYQIDKDYKEVIQNCKNKYGSNWEFYLQNQYLAPLGGTEDSYKHAKLVEKIKTDFISKVFAKNYFGYRTDEKLYDFYPQTFTAATKNVDKNKLRNPNNWDRIGFFARAELGFDPGEIPSTKGAVKPEWLAKHPDGDYAAIQQFVFDRWFVTEKPFFADAALFKYSNPKNVAHGKLEEIYDAQRTQVKLPATPNEPFPFFGNDSATGTAKAVKFISEMNKGNFRIPYEDGTEYKTNGTITIPLKASDDTQTCLLVSGNKMFAELYTPYAMAAGNLYSQMMGTSYTAPNTLEQSAVETKINQYTGETDDFSLLSIFFYNATDGKPSTITKTLDLETIYGRVKEDTSFYHCPIFLDTPNYNYFYGITGSKAGVQYITNNIQTEFNVAPTGETAEKQPWVMELNESGIHFLTIDGFNYVKNAGEGKQLDNLKKVVMFRLMQKQANDAAAANISSNLLEGKNNLKTYFTENFTNIVLEMAMLDKENNVFRPIESYTDTESEDKLFLNTICSEQSLNTKYSLLKEYLTAINDYDEAKKCLSTFDAANSKIYSYRSKQISNVKSKEIYSKTLFENGLTAPFIYEPTSQYTAETGATTDINRCTYDWSDVNRVILQDHSELVTDTRVTGWSYLETELANIKGKTFVTDAVKATVDGTTSGFSPQISTAKSKTSNRFWYKSSLVDKIMYSYMGSKANTANGIKLNAYNYYMAEHGFDKWFGTTGKLNSVSTKHAFASTYARNKLFTGEKNLASYAADMSAASTADQYFSLLNDCFVEQQRKAKIENGETADDVMNYVLWQAAVMYLINPNKDTGEPTFDNFYTILNSKISDDETAIVGYLTKGDTVKTSTLSETKLGQIVSGTKTDYDYTPDVDNIFDRNGYEGKTHRSGEDVFKLASASQWNVVNKVFKNGAGKDFSGFLGIQTKANNQLDSASDLQNVVFNKFAKSIFGATDIDTGNTYAQNHGCWFQFAGSKDSKGQVLKIANLTAKLGEKEVTFNADTWFPADDSKYAPVRKVAKKIREYGSMDDLRTLAQTLNDSYDGVSDFASIADGTTTFEDIDEMRMKMLSLLPSKMYHTENEYIWFQRVSNVEARTLDSVPSIVFEDGTGKNSFKLLMTQINKADALEKTLTPKWESTEWERGDNSPISAEEFWNILFAMASESTVQQRAVTEIVKTAFGDGKLVVYDAQLYNQFDSVWIKDWSKKTMGV